jgi:plastocyanin
MLMIAVTFALVLPSNVQASAAVGPTSASPVVPTSHSRVANVTLPVGQPPTSREIIVEWMKDQAGQDRFNPEFIVVNQGDTVNLVFINNDTVGHDFVIGPPYNIMINATVPGMYNDLTLEKFTTPALHNSPGVVVTGTPGNVSASYSFVAKYPGIFEYVCTYHIQVGMIGYLVVLSPNTSAVTQPSAQNQTVPQSSALTQVGVDAGSGTNVNLAGYTPTDITVVIGINNTVKWTNNDNMAHTVTATDGSFDSGNLNPSATYVHTFTQVGVYHYTCTYHSWMHGTVTVTSENLGQESGEHGGFTVILTAYEVYGIVGFGIVILVSLMLVFARTEYKKE